MGGHGALICFLKNPGLYESVSAFAPICAPSDCPWGIKAFTGYLGNDQEAWKEWDASHLINKYSGPAATIRIEQGSLDEFLSVQLRPWKLLERSLSSPHSGLQLDLKVQYGYDHSYYFVSTFIDEHIKEHALHLKATPQTASQPEHKDDTL